jgi:hypothetical protein
MTTLTCADWSDVDAAARLMSGNWRQVECFCWHRGHDLEDADKWMIWYTTHRDAGLLEQSNEHVINERLKPFGEGDDPDFVFERHSHWAVGHVDGFSIRVFREGSTITAAFKEFCQIKEALDSYPVLDEQDYSEREYTATLENYRSEMWRLKDDLSDGWEAEVHSWFSDHGQDRYTANLDDQGGWAPKEKIVEALRDLGLLPTLVVVN